MVVLYEFSNSVNTKNIFITTPDDWNSTRLVRDLFFLLHSWKSESCIVEKTNLPANCKESTVETLMLGHNSSIIYYHSL